MVGRYIVDHLYRRKAELWESDDNKGLIHGMHLAWNDCVIKALNFDDLEVMASK